MDRVLGVRPFRLELGGASDDGTVIVTLIGEFDLDGEQLFREVVTEGVVRDGHAVVALDASDVTFLDSSGLRFLLEARKEALSHRSRVVLLRPSPIVERILAMSGLAEMFDVSIDGAGLVA